MRITTFLVLGLILLLHSCQSDVKLAQDPTLRLVPATATSVSVLRVPQVLKKADFNDFQQLPIYRELVRDLSGDNAALAHVLDQPQDSGIDWGKNAYLFNEISPANPEAMIQGVLFTLKDAKAFGSFLAKMNQEIEPQTGYQMIRANRQGYLLWNDDTALFGLSMQPSAQTDDFLGQIIRGELESVADNADLQKAFDNEYDISSWASTNAFAEYGDARMMVANLGFDPDALKDNFVHSYANFEDGIMRSHSTFHLQEALTKDLDLLFKDAIQSDLADYLPAKDFQMGFTAALDLEGLNQVLAERVQTRSFINYALQSYDLTLEDLTLAFGGDLYWGNYQGDNTEANSLFVTTINDPERLDKLIQTGTQMGILKETAPGRYQLGPVPVATTSGGIGMAMANMVINTAVSMVIANIAIVSTAT